MKKVKEYDMINKNGVVVGQTYANSPKEAKQNADKCDTGLTISKRGRPYGIVFDAINARSPIHRSIA
jgi:hypothetical protein